MSDYTDRQEDEEIPAIHIPAENTARFRLIKSLLLQRFYLWAALIYSAFLNLILIWEYKL